MKKALLPTILWLAACGSPSLAQSRSPGQALPAWELVQQGKIAEAVKVARKSPDGATTALRQLMEASDLHVTNRKIEEAVATLAAAAKFADAYDKAAKTQIPRAALQGRQLRLQGIQESDRQDYADAEATLKKALEVSRGIDDPVLAAGIHNNLGYALQHQEKYEEAAAEYDQARQMAEAQQDELRAGSYNFNLGQVLLQLRRNEEALEAFRRAESQNHSSGQTSLEARALLMQGVALGRVNATSKEPLKHFSRARELFEKIGDIRNCGWALYLAGDHIAYTLDFQEAVKYGELAIPCFEKAGDKGGLRAVYSLLSEMYARVKDPRKSEEYRKRASEIPPDR